MKCLKIAFLSVFTLLSTQTYSEEKYTSITCYQEGKVVISNLKLKGTYQEGKIIISNLKLRYTEHFKSENVTVITGIDENDKEINLIDLKCSLTDY